MLLFFVSLSAHNKVGGIQKFDLTMTIDQSTKNFELPFVFRTELRIPESVITGNFVGTTTREFR